MRRSTKCAPSSSSFVLTAFIVAACAAPAPSYTSGGNMRSAQAAQDQIARGRFKPGQGAIKPASECPASAISTGHSPSTSVKKS